MATPERTLDPAQEAQHEATNGHSAHDALTGEADWATFRPEPPNIDHLITEDDTPVDNWFSETQQRLLTRALYASWRPEQPFVAMANVGLFNTMRLQAIVPAVLVSLGVAVPEEMFEKEHRSYFVWEYGKAPDVVIEIVSNRKGSEVERKVERYGSMGVPYYAVFAPIQLVQNELLVVYQLLAGAYRRKDNTFFELLDLGLTPWDGLFEQKPGRWLRWVDSDGNLLLTGEERAEQAEDRAEQAENHAAQLAAKLRELGVDPSEI